MIVLYGAHKKLINFDFLFPLNIFLTDATKPIFENLYESVANGSETRRSLTKNSTPNYRAELEVELAEIADHEMWRVGKTVRKLRPENN